MGLSLCFVGLLAIVPEQSVIVRAPLYRFSEYDRVKVAVEVVPRERSGLCSALQVALGGAEFVVNEARTSSGLYVGTKRLLPLVIIFYVAF